MFWRREKTVRGLDTRVCLHVVRPLRVDVRAQRTIDALERDGYRVEIIDVEEEAGIDLRPLEGTGDHQGPHNDRPYGNSQNTRPLEGTGDHQGPHNDRPYGNNQDTKPLEGTGDHQGPHNDHPYGNNQNTRPLEGTGDHQGPHNDRPYGNNQNIRPLEGTGDHKDPHNDRLYGNNQNTRPLEGTGDHQGPHNDRPYGNNQNTRPLERTGDHQGPHPTIPSTPAPTISRCLSRSSVFHNLDSSVRARHIILPRWHRARSFEPLFFLKALQAFTKGLCWLLRCDAEIYHACEVTALPACFIAAKIRRKPLIFEAYEMPLHDIPLAEMGRLRRVFHGLLSLLLPHLIARCQAVIAVSPPIVAEIKRCYHIERVFLVRNMLPYRAVARSERLRDYLGLAPSTRVVLYQGYLQSYRGLDILIRAAPLLDADIVIVLMGKSIGATQERLESLARELGVTERVRVIPPVPYDELLAWTASADIGLTPLSPEQTLTMKWCLPNKVFEYIMAGLPVLSAPLEAVQELLDGYDVGQTFSTALPSAVAHAINSMLADRVALVRMHENALRAARELCWENERERLLAVYESVLHGLRTK